MQKQPNLSTLRYRIRAARIGKGVAAHLGIAYTNLWRKLRGEQGMTQEQLDKILGYMREQGL